MSTKCFPNVYIYTQNCDMILIILRFNEFLQVKVTIKDRSGLEKGLNSRVSDLR